jgi:hypothetical protein
MLAMLGLVGSCLSLAQMFLLELRELEHISWTFWEVPLLVLFTKFLAPLYGAPFEFLDIFSVQTRLPNTVRRMLDDGYTI